MEFRTEWRKRVTSTNRVLKERVLEEGKLPDGWILAAREQTAGRGRLDRSWEAAPDRNLTFSLFIRTAVPLERIPSAAMAAALGVDDYLQELGVASAPKWPNDVIVGEKKICGILSDRVGEDGLIIGVGLNVGMTEEEARGIGRPATSIRIETGSAPDPERALEELLPRLGRWLPVWRDYGFDGLRKTWLERCGPPGKPLRVHDGPEIKQGTLAGFGPSGELLMKTERGVERIWSGDLFGE